MKHLVMATVVTLLMLSPAQGADVCDLPGALLVASNEKGPKARPPVVIIKGQGGKVGVLPAGSAGDKKIRTI